MMSPYDRPFASCVLAATSPALLIATGSVAAVPIIGSMVSRPLRITKPLVLRPSDSTPASAEPSAFIAVGLLHAAVMARSLRMPLCTTATGPRAVSR